MGRAGVGTEHALQGQRSGNISRNYIQLYSSAHFACNVGASQCTGAVGTGSWRHSKPDTDAETESDTDSKTESDANAETESDTDSKTKSNTDPNADTDADA